MRLSLALLCLFACSLRAAPAVCAIPQRAHTDLTAFLQGRDVLTITNYTGDLAYLEVVEAILVHQILDAGGWKEGIRLQPVPSVPRMLQKLRQQEVELTATTLWKQDLTKFGTELSLSPALIPEGKYVVGFYVPHDHEKALSATNLVQLRSLRAVSNRFWSSHWATLTALSPDKIYHAPQWSLMPQMLQTRRADFMLSPFQPNQEMVLHTEQIRLLPIPGIKAVLPGSRHIAFNAQSERHHELSSCFQKGFEILNQSGRIQRAYEQCGFQHPAVKDWEVIIPGARKRGAE